MSSTSCKVLPPGDSLSESPVAWRQMRGGAGASRDVAVSERLAGMERECERRAAEAHAAGMREGETAGRKQASAELQSVVERLAGSIEELAGMRAGLRREAEADLVELSIAIARRILRREIAVDPEALHGLVLAALEKLQAGEICRVRVHPLHAALLSSCLRQRSGAAIEIVSDPGCAPGTVVFETERGNLDASVESQLREIERGLADRLRGRA